ncbi:MAG: LysR family transcriptional regulator [Mesorhizobium sp.]|nr:MAG: LysR family transcriptional regulator [Mesorhizobium sp.]TIP42600.1 MAG: LysR family transcriptional regulator [Mesorhizobium sp.]TJV70256.1 MAG: LysR family transcriptional regulator [Mesorhizobium sp.]
MPMPVSLPALRAFVEVGRNGSVKGAAKDLGVTPGAVSQQIKLLELQLGVRLFDRGNREIKLTREGLLLYGNLAPGFQQIDDAISLFADRRPGPETLIVTTTPTFAACWLTSRIGRFSKLHPTIEVRIEITEQPIDLKAEAIDVGVRYGAGKWPGLDAVRLFSPRLIVVASPDLLMHGPLTTPADCLRYPLLHDRIRTDWSTWFAASGVRLPKGTMKGPSYPDDTLLIQAASTGQGLAVVRDVSANDALASGKIVIAIDKSVPTQDGYYAIAPTEKARIAKVKRFRDWILSEASETQRRLSV